MRVKKIISSFMVLIVLFFWNNDYLAAEEETTHLQISPGKLSINEVVKVNKEIFIYKYKVKNNSTLTKDIVINSTGNLKTNGGTITLKPQETYSFDVFLKVPIDARSGEKTDYVVVETTHNGESTISLKAKVKYEVEKKPQYILIIQTYYLELVLFFIGFVLLLYLLFGSLEDKEKEKEVAKKRKSKK